MEYFSEGGPLMYLILLCSIVGLAVFLERLYHLYRARIDTDKFMAGIRAEEEAREKLEEEKRLKEEKIEEIRSTVDGWIDSGYVIPSFPDIMEKSFEDIDFWYSDLSSNIGRIKEDLACFFDVEGPSMESRFTSDGFTIVV